MIRGLLYGTLFATIAFAQGVTFQRTELGISGQGTILPGDFNNDGSMDLLQVTATSLLTRLGNGDGTFQEAVRTNTPPVNNTAAIVADFNQDGIPDVALGSAIAALDPVVFFFQGDGRGGFVPTRALTLPSSLGNPGLFITHTWVHSITAADLNRDGRIDLLVHTEEEDLFYPTSGPFHALLGRGDGTFQILPPFDDNYEDNSVLADLNHDGALDLIVKPYGVPTSGVNPAYARPYVMLGSRDGTFRIGPSLPVDPSEMQIGLTGLTAADLDRDGNVDLVLSVRGALMILFSGAGGQFRTARIPIPDVTQIRAADITGDGIPDLLLSRSKSILVLQGNGDGSFQKAVEVGESDNPIEAVSDWNQDGRPDLITPALLFWNRTPARLAPSPVLSAAGIATAGVAPNMLVSIYGSFLADATRPERTKVRINGVDLKLLYVSSAQINALVAPSPGPAGPGRLQVESPAGLVESEITVVEYAPAVFVADQSSGAGMFLHSDGALVTSRAPARVGETLTMICTGLGRIGETPQIKIGDTPAAVLSAGVALMTSLVNIVEFVMPDVPPPAQAATLSVHLVIGGVGSNTVTIPVE